MFSFMPHTDTSVLGNAVLVPFAKGRQQRNMKQCAVHSVKTYILLGVVVQRKHREAIDLLDHPSRVESDAVSVISRSPHVYLERAVCAIHATATGHSCIAHT